MNSYNTAVLTDSLEHLNFKLEDNQIRQFLSYYELLVEWNKVMNLTGITEFHEVMIKHFLDSLAIIKICNLEEINRVIDVGTGAGFPGIPLKIAFPHLNITLLDSLQKRIHFLDEVIKELDLKEIQTIHGRAEDCARQGAYRETFDLSVSRAVANLSSLSEYCLPFVKLKGTFISYKSGKIEEELAASQKAVHLLGANISSHIKFQLPETNLERSFVVIEKVSPTPKKYPRKAGMPMKNPI